MSNFNYKDEDLEVQNGWVVWVDPDLYGELVLPEGTVGIEFEALVDVGVSEFHIPSTLKYFDILEEYKRTYGFVRLVVDKEIVPSQFLAGAPLQNIIFGTNVQRIEKGAFMQCDNLEEIIFESECPEVSNQAFSKCNDLNNVFVQSALNLEEGTFKSCGKVNIKPNEGVEKVFLPLWATREKKFEADFGTVEFRQFL